MSRGAGVTAGELADLQATAAAARGAFLEQLAALVSIDCGTYTPEGVDRVGTWVGAALAHLGATVERHATPGFAATVTGAFRGESGPRVLMIGHLDTVFEPGTAAARPFRIDGNRAYGPGVTDMKAGLLAGLHAIAALRAPAALVTAWPVLPRPEAAGGAGGNRPAAGPLASTPEGSQPTPGTGRWLPFARLTFVANPDEEVGSPASTPLIAKLARSHDVALVLECARANGDVVAARKGHLHARLTLHGRSAHAGVEPGRGRSAVLEAAHKTVALHGLQGRWPGVTCNVGAIRGGTRPNIVPDEAVLDVDLRASTRQGLEAATAALRDIAARTKVPGVRCRVTVVSRHPPMDRTPGGDRLLSRARAVARVLGFAIRGASTGGVSDANTTAGLGVPTLDGLGPIGGRDHSPWEYLELDSIAPRVAHLAGLLLAIARDDAFAPPRRR